MPALFINLHRRGRLCGHRLAAFLWQRAVVVALWMGAGFAINVSIGQEQVAPNSEAIFPEAAFVAYLSEVPYQWQSELGNPLELWARKLSSEWAATPEGTNERLRNLKQELSWENMAKTARTGKAHAFVIHGYEFIEHADAAQIDALLVPLRNGKAAMTEFVILRQRPAKRRVSEFKMGDLKDLDILVDRGSCGELVYRWLDREVKIDTGTSRRDHVTEFHTASSAPEAILAVYFGEAHVCVVSREAYTEIIRYNPQGIAAKLEVLRTSPPFLQHIIACPRGLPLPRRKDLIKRAAGIRLVQADGIWTLAAPREEDSQSVTGLIRDWQEYFGAQELAARAATEPAATPPPEKPTPPSSVSGRRQD